MTAIHRLGLFGVLVIGGLALAGSPAEAQKACANTECSGESECTYAAGKVCSFDSQGKCTTATCT